MVSVLLPTPLSPEEVDVVEVGGFDRWRAVAFVLVVVVFLGLGFAVGGEGG